MPPIELESGRLQLTDDEMSLYTSAAALLVETYRECVPLHVPMTRTQFVKLFLAHCVVTGDEELMSEITVVIENEIAQRKRPH